MNIREIIIQDLDDALSELEHWPTIARTKLEHLCAFLDAWPDVQILGKPAIVEDPDNWHADLFPDWAKR